MMSAIIAHAIAFISVQQSQTPIFRHRWVSTSAKRSQQKSISRFPSQPNPRVGTRTTDMPVDCTVCKKSRTLFSVAAQQVTHRWIALSSKELVNTNHPTYRSRTMPSIAQQWDEQSDVAPYPIIRPSCFYDSNRRYTGEEMRQIVELSRSYTQGYRANQGEFELNEARRLRSTEHVSVLLLNFAISIVRLISTAGSHYPESSPRRTNTPFFRTILLGIRLISQSFSRPTESSDTESFLTNINAYVSWPRRMANHLQLQQFVPQISLVLQDWNSSAESSSKANA